jgi:hypothetical protein
MRRPVLAVGYPELEHFGSLIRTYADVAELAALTDEIAAGRSAELMAPRSDAEAFVAVSGWDERMEQVLAAIPPAWTASAVAP